MNYLLNGLAVQAHFKLKKGFQIKLKKGVQSRILCVIIIVRKTLYERQTRP